MSRYADCINIIGLIYLDQGNYSEALSKFEESLDLFQVQENLNGQTKSLINLGLIDQNQGIYNEALKKFDEALKICEQNNFLKRKIACFKHIGYKRKV